MYYRYLDAVNYFSMSSKYLFSVKYSLVSITFLNCSLWEWSRKFLSFLKSKPSVSVPSFAQLLSVDLCFENSYSTLKIAQLCFSYKPTSVFL